MLEEEREQNPFSETGYTQSFENIQDAVSYSLPVIEPVKKKHPFLKKAVGLLISAACFGAVSAACFLGVTKLYAHFNPDAPLISDTPTAGTPYSPSLIIAPTELSNVGEMDGSETVKEVVRNAKPAMVSIESTFQTTSYFFGQPITRETSGGGSGIIVGKNDTDILIATNHHVINDATAVTVTFTDDTTAPATLKGSDPQADLAIIAVSLKSLSAETLSKIDIAVLGDSDSACVGEMVIAIGNALGYGSTTTVGYLSAKDREVTIEGNDMILLQTDAAINEGNSGGALLNTRGEVIGINNAKLSSTRVEGVCFAIPISKATPILKELMSREILSEEEKGYLGISLKEMDSSITQFFGNWPTGVYVYSVTADSPAAAAGIYAGDIITKINGISVTTPNQLINAVTSNRIGTTVEVTLQRNIDGQFKELTFSVTLGPKPE